MAALTGATLITSELGLTLEDVTEEHLGSSDKVTSDKGKTSIIGGHGETEDIENRITIIKAEKEKSDSDFEKEKLQTRLSKLSGGVAVIKVGAESEVELKEKKDRVDDAILSTKAALEEGIVPGGGSALIHCELSIEQRDAALSVDKNKGVDIVYSACYSPFKTIVSNAGLSSDTLIERIKTSPSLDKTMGYNVVTEEFCDLVKEGVVDPTKVTRTAIEKAVSVAGTLLTTSCMVVNEPKSDEEQS